MKNQLIETDGENFYEMDFDNLLSIIDGAKMLVLCNPHNPAGITWSKETLQRLADICYEHNVIVISDEIHADLAIFGHKHVPFATVSDKAKNISVTFQAPTKTFNVAALVSSYAIVPNDKIREKSNIKKDAMRHRRMKEKLLWCNSIHIALQKLCY